MAKLIVVSQMNIVLWRIRYILFCEDFFLRPCNPPTRIPHVTLPKTSLKSVPYMVNTSSLLFTKTKSIRSVRKWTKHWFIVCQAAYRNHLARNLEGKPWMWADVLWRDKGTARSANVIRNCLKIMNEPQSCCCKECDRVLIDSWLTGAAPNSKIIWASHLSKTGLNEKKMWKK